MRIDSSYGDALLAKCGEALTWAVKWFMSSGRIKDQGPTVALNGGTDQADSDGIVSLLLHRDCPMSACQMTLRRSPGMIGQASATAVKMGQENYHECTPSKLVTLPRTALSDARMNVAIETISVKVQRRFRFQSQILVRREAKRGQVVGGTSVSCAKLINVFNPTYLQQTRAIHVPFLSIAQPGEDGPCHTHTAG